MWIIALFPYWVIRFQASGGIAGAASVYQQTFCDFDPGNGRLSESLEIFGAGLLVG
jgi:hypothetical protein